MRILVALIAVLLLVTAADARSRRVTYSRMTATVQPASTTSPATITETTSTETVSEALVEVNAARAARGLRPFAHDPLLTEGAIRAAAARARSLIAGHTSNDFGYLPPGASARAAGCAAWPAGMGWGACCTYEGYGYAGAAYAIGPDGRRYMHLFVR